MNEKGIKPQSSEEQSQKRNAIDIAKEHIQQLCEGFQQSPEKIAEYLTFAAQFYNYSARNTMLIYHKNPHAIFVSSRTKFQEMGFALKRGEYFKPTWILRPEKKAFFQRGDEIVALKNATREERELLAQGTLETFTRTYFRPARVYELAQTDCPPEQYPKICGRGFSDAEHKALYERLKVAAELGGFSIEIHTLNSSSLSGYCIPEDKRIVLNENLGDTERLVTLNHEWAHGMLHISSDLAPEIKEFEAEAASIVLQQRFNLPVSDESRAYIANCLRQCHENPDFNLEKSLCRVINHANFVSEHMELEELRQAIQNTLPQEHSIEQINQAFMQNI